MNQMATMANSIVGGKPLAFIQRQCGCSDEMAPQIAQLILLHIHGRYVMLRNKAELVRCVHLTKDEGCSS